MRHWMLWIALLGGVLLARPAQADDELATSNAVSNAWDRYALLSSRDDPESARMLGRGSLDYFAFPNRSAAFRCPSAPWCMRCARR